MGIGSEIGSPMLPLVCRLFNHSFYCNYLLRLLHKLLFEHYGVTTAWIHLRRWFKCVHWANIVKFIITRNTTVLETSPVELHASQEAPLSLVVSLPYTNTNEGFTYRKCLYSMQENWRKNQLTALCNLLHTFQYSNQIVHSWGRQHSSWQRGNLEHNIINDLGLIWFC